MSLFRTQETFREDAHDAFKLFAISPGKEIQVSDLPMVMRCLGFEPGSEVEKVILAESNADEIGVVPQHIFSSIIAGLGEGEACRPPQPDEVIEAFRQFDREGGGFITSSEIRHLLSGMEDELEETKIQDLIHDRLLDGDGQLNYHEFVDILSSTLSGTPPTTGNTSGDERESDM